MALLETIRPDELLDFFVELAEIEQEEILWELYVPTLSNPFADSKSFDDFKAKVSKTTSKTMRQTKAEELEAIERAEAILKITKFVKVEE